MPKLLSRDELYRVLTRLQTACVLVAPEEWDKLLAHIDALELMMNDGRKNG